MRTLKAFTQVSLDGYYKDAEGDVSWTHDGAPDAEFDAWVGENASSGNTLLFGRVTFDMMEAFWPSALAAARMPRVAAHMGHAHKLVVSHGARASTWQNTEFLSGDLLANVARLKREPRPDWGGSEPITILGSGSIVAQLTRAGLIDEYHVLVIPVLLGSGTRPFDDASPARKLQLVQSKTFNNGKVSLVYRTVTA